MFSIVQAWHPCTYALAAVRRQTDAHTSFCPSLSLSIGLVYHHELVALVRPQLSS